MKRKSNLFGEDILKSEEEKKQESQSEEQKTDQIEEHNQEETNTNENKVSELSTSNLIDNEPKKKIETKLNSESKLLKESVPSSNNQLTEEEKGICLIN